MKKIFFLRFFVSPSVFPLLQDIQFKHVAKHVEFTKTNKKCTKNLKRYHVHDKKKLLRRVDKMANVEKENSKTLSEEAIDTLINCFQ